MDLIINFGTLYSKVGYTENESCEIIPSFLKDNEFMDSYENRIFIRGYFENNDLIDIFLEKILNKFNNTKNIIWAESNDFPDFQKNKILEILFNKYNLEKVKFVNEDILALNSIGVTKGVIINFGEGITQINTIYDNYRIEENNKKINLGGEDIRKILYNKCLNYGYNFKYKKDFKILEEIKNSCVYCDSEKNPILNNNYYLLPDGNELKIENLNLGNIYFDPYKYGYNFDSIKVLYNNVLEELDFSIKRYINDDIYFIGGNSNIDGLKNKFIENSNLNCRINIYNDIDIIWKGAKIHSKINNNYITKEEFIEREGIFY